MKDNGHMVEENVVNVPDFVPGEDYRIELVNGDQTPIARARLNASVDGAAATRVRSDDSGIIRVHIEPSTQNVTLTSIEEQEEE